MPIDSPEADRVRLSIKLIYGSGQFAEGVKNVAFATFVLLYYNQVLGLSGTLAGLAIFIALCFDAITDPVVGSISDNFKSRWGRRHPFMYAAAIPMAFSFLLSVRASGGTLIRCAVCVDDSIYSPRSWFHDTLLRAAPGVRRRTFRPLY